MAVSNRFLGPTQVTAAMPRASTPARPGAPGIRGITALAPEPAVASSEQAGELRVANPGEWEHFVSSSFYPLSLESAAEDFTADGRLTALRRGIRVAELSTGASGFKRTPRLIAGSPSDDLLFLVQLAGEATIEQAGRQLVLRAGHATFCDPSAPYAGRALGRQRQIVAMVPRREVLDARTGVTAVRLQDLSLRFAPIRVFLYLAGELALDPGSEDDVERAAVASVAAELLRSAAILAATTELDGRSWSHETQRRAVQEYLLARLGDATLTMDRAAAANGMSVRQLTAIFEPGDSPGAYLRRERLRRAHEDLIMPAAFGVPVAEIGTRWGYPNPSTFGRAYRRAYGQAPTDARREALDRR